MSLPLRITMLFALSLQAQSTLKITYPSDGTIVHPGETIVIYLSVSGPPLVVATVMAFDPIPSSQMLTGPPYQFSITIPTQITPGIYLLTGVGRTATSDLLSSEPVSIDVERPDSPQKITSRSTGLELAIGQQLPIAVHGTYKDGSIVDLSESTQTKYISQSPDIATVSKDGQVTAIAPGKTNIVIDGILVISVTVEAPIRMFPTKVTLQGGQTYEFIARLSNPRNGPVTWQLNPDVGTVVNGVYTAPATLDSKQTVMLTAASAVDPNVTASAIITLSPLVTVSVVPAYAVLYSAETQKFSAVASNTGTGLAWSISPAAAGSIDSNGIYTAPGYIPKLQSVKITATSMTNPGISGSTTIYISPHPFQIVLPSPELRVSPGTARVMDITLLATDGFWHPITLSIEGLPSGATATFSPPAIKGNTVSSLTLNIANSAARGNYKVTVAAQDTISPDLRQSQALKLVIE